MIEVFKTIISLSTEFMSAYLPLKSCPYSFRSGRLKNVTSSSLIVGMSALTFFPLTLFLLGGGSENPPPGFFYITFEQV